ncbi:MAG: polysaccharide deacetylase family protein [Bacteroidetes bacterium]|nr:polysaccharide deacetylase family protein [Bacteroidota bacterium]
MTSLFEIYSNANEYYNSLPDEFGRARIYSSKNPDIFSPILSKKFFDNGFIPHYPDNKDFAVCVSHDVDHLYLNQSFNRKLLGAARNMWQGKYELGNYYIRALIKPRVFNEYDLKKLIAIDNSYGIKSSYYFLTLEERERDFNYNIKTICNQIEMVMNDKSEIGLHGGHQAFNNFDKLIAEKEKLQNETGITIDGYRSHYLRFELPLTWNILSQAGFLYDTTFGYADCVGFRNGMCYPYYPFDINQNKFIDIVELPLIVMDATLFYYMRLDEDKAINICAQLIKKVKECKGVFTLLWHNNFLVGPIGEFYKKLLALLKQEDPWFATSKELIQWWKQEKLLQLSKDIISDLVNNRTASIAE